MFLPFDLSIFLTAEIVTNMVEVYKGKNVHCQFNTKCGTLQMDMSSNLSLHFAKKELFQYVTTSIG